MGHSEAGGASRRTGRAGALEASATDGGELALFVRAAVPHLLKSDIIFGVMWSVEVEPEVEEWLDGLAVKEFALVLAHLDRLAKGWSGASLKDTPQRRTDDPQDDRRHQKQEARSHECG